jgi:hypothetical protein
MEPWPNNLLQIVFSLVSFRKKIYRQKINW